MRVLLRNKPTQQQVACSTFTLVMRKLDEALLCFCHHNDCACQDCRQALLA